MNTIIVVNAGENTGLNFIRSLRKAGGWTIIGIDSLLSDYHGSEADVRYLLEWEEEQEFFEFLAKVAVRHGADLVYVADTDRELAVVTRRRDELDVTTFLPDLDDHLRMENKWVTYEVLKAAAIAVPDTELVTDIDVVANMLHRYGKVWLRLVEGAAGQGSVATDSLEFAQAWIDREQGWGAFTVARCLSSRTATLSALWYDGELVASQLRERMGWRYPYMSVSGVTGITSGQRTIWDEELHEIGVAAIRAMTKRPHGAIGVDFTYDHDGRPMPTEVQPARFYSSMQFLAEAGLNFPALYCDLALHGRRTTTALVNPIRDHLYWVKSVDRLPQLLTEDQYLAR